MKDFFSRYADRVTPGEKGECWVWRGATTSSLGYGHFNRDGDHHYAHRAAYEAVNGDGSASGKVVRHRCDNPPCCNPDHLLVGTHKDNNRDMYARGRARHARGAGVNTCKLTEADVLEMRRRAASGEAVSSIIKTKPVNQGAGMAAVTGRTWRHLPEAVPGAAGRPRRKRAECTT